jgi:hypothetical protein
MRPPKSASKHAKPIPNAITKAQVSTAKSSRIMPAAIASRFCGRVHVYAKWSRWRLSVVDIVEARIAEPHAASEVKTITGTP